MLEGYKKVEGIMKLKELGLPTPPTLIIKDYEIQKNEINNFLLTRNQLMIRSDSKEKSTHCPSMINCKNKDAMDFIKKLNNDGYVAIMQDYVPLNNRYSGNILVLENEYIIEAIHGGPVSKLNREGVLHEHIRISKEGKINFIHGDKVIPEKELSAIINRLKELPVKHNIIEFSSGPDWFYFWHAREDPTSKVLEK